MSKKILGDNPFDIDVPSATPGPEIRPVSVRVNGASGSSEPLEAGEPEEARDSRNPRNDDSVPDAALPPDAVARGGAEPAGADTGRAISDEASSYPDTTEEFFGMLGGEAAVPEGDYGPPIPSVFSESSFTSEIRELENRIRVRLTPAFPVDQPRRLPLEFLWKRYRRLAMRDRSEIVDEFGRDPVYMARYEPMLEFFYKVYFRAEARGLDNVPDTGRALLVANHAGTLPYDAALIMYAMRREHPARRDARPLVEDFVFHFPYLGTFFNRIGGVRACPENAERLLEDDQVIVVFPEGLKGVGKLYRQRYKLQRFGRGGFIKLALRTRAPIIPVAIIGAEDTNPMLGKVTWLAKSLGIPHIPITPTFPWLGPAGLTPLPSKWHLRFGEPIDVAAEHGPDAAEDRILVNRLADNVRSTIQRMVDETLAAERPTMLSTFFGR